jgi:2-polyprenyl-3-methyl-5-hydroxy-6-metoxy-1,4-benzoquinol methylase
MEKASPQEMVHTRRELSQETDRYSAGKPPSRPGFAFLYNHRMDSDIARRLVDLNRAFYQTFAAPFAETRLRVQPGARRLLERIPPDAAVADLGCGNGNAAGWLAGRGHRGSYLGLDLSDSLLEIARGQDLSFPAEFRATDLLKEGWASGLTPGSFDVVLAFAVIHHLPGESGREAFLNACRNLLAPNAKLFFSHWQFLRSAKLRARIVPWQEAGFVESDMDSGDYLLDWRREGTGLRYVHVMDAQERQALAKHCGFSEVESFSSDGEGGRLSDYAVWQPVAG